MTFGDYFKDKTMRVDFYHTADADTDLISLDRIYEYGPWGRSHQHLLDNFNNGGCYFKVYDEKTDTLLYSKGFNSYCGEYQTTQPAIDGIKRTFHQAAIIPAPLEPIKFCVERRDKKGHLQEIFSNRIEPDDTGIIRTRPQLEGVEVFAVQKNGPPEKRVDVVILAEGYTQSEKEKFVGDLKRASNTFFEGEPFKSHRAQFNLYGIYKSSLESGVDEPHAGIYRNTTLSSSFNALGIERYLLPEDNKTLMDLAEYVPADSIYVMVNDGRYAGGGIYNQFCVFTADAESHRYILTHEFGHSFAGLSDEYYTKAVTYVDFHKPGLEPEAPNVTALLDPDNVKWKKLLSDGVDLPTPWNKDTFEAFEAKWQKEQNERYSKIDKLKREGASQEEIEKAQAQYHDMDVLHVSELDQVLRDSENWNKVGAFEGAGFVDKGLYRSMIDCIMFSKGATQHEKPFCRVCEAAIEKVIQHYID